MTKAKRKITKFDFSGDEAHVAIVDKAANAQEVLVMKAAPKTEEEVQKAVEVNLKLTLMQFLTQYMGLWYDEAEQIAGMMGYSYEDLYDEEDMVSFKDMVQDNLDKVTVNKSETTEKFVENFSKLKEKFSTKSLSSVEDGGDAVNSTEDKSQKVNKMTDQTKESLEEQINKAAEKIVAERIAEIEKASNSKVEEISKQLETFKAAEAAREKQAYLAKAEKIAAHLGEDADKEEIAKSLAFVEKSEEGKAVSEVLKALLETLEKDEDGLFEEVGKSATKEQPSGEEAKIEELQKSLMKADPNLRSFEAYVQAADQIRGA